MEKVIQNSPALVQLKRLHIAWIEYVELPGLFDFINSCIVMHDAESTASVLQSSQIFPGSSLSVTVLLNTNWGENGNKDEALFPLLHVHLF